MDKLLTEIQVSDSLQVSLACLRRWRLRGEGPQYIKVGPLVRYRPQDLDDWIAALPSGGNGYRFPVQEPKGGQTGCFRLDAVLNIATVI
jgi:predicted DNA-binding transcriptional regulator AlpA